MGYMGYVGLAASRPHVILSPIKPIELIEITNLANPTDLFLHLSVLLSTVARVNCHRKICFSRAKFVTLLSFIPAYYRA